MSSQSPDDDDLSGLEDEPAPDGYLHTIIVDITIPGDPDAVAQTHDFEICSDRPLTFNQVWARVQLQIRRWLEVLAESPRFRERFGTAPDVKVAGFAITHGC